ncbi:MAG: hypothetical protein JWO80_4732 [Bryobacterales bacterium]|nr:hypothetical protein [Bryobacterales bacterium]
MRTKMFSALLLGGALLLAAGTARADLFAISYYNFFPNVLYRVNTATGQAMGSGLLLQGASGVVGITFSQDGTLYGLTASDGSTRNAFYRIDPVASTAALIGPTGLSNIAKGDIAFDPVTHTLYGVGEIPSPGITDLFTIDLTTGHATIIGPVDTGRFGGGLAALAFDPLGNLFILNTTVPADGINLSRLLKVNKATGAVINTLDLTGAHLGYSAGLAFDPATGTAYIADGNFRGTNTLYTLNTSTGVLSAVGPTGTAFRFGISSLAFSPGPDSVTVTIDVKPDGDPPRINPTSHGTTPVAIVSSPTFNAPAQTDVTSLTFGATGNEHSLVFCSRAEDINGDGLLDVVCHFRTELLGFKNPGGTVAILKGKTVTGLSLHGMDAVVIIGH